MSKIDDLNIESYDDVITPNALKATRGSRGIRRHVEESRAQVKRLITGAEKKLLVAVGPCSIHSLAAGREYAKRLSALARDLSDGILLMMRVYFEKPRTTTGWKGLVYDPGLDGTDDMDTGLKLAREFLLYVNELGLPVITEFLDPIVPAYLADLVTIGTIGARTSESQTHRQLASGLSMPIGFKNGTDGSTTTALNAVMSARGQHVFFGIDGNAKVRRIKTKGNDAAFVILRGGTSGPNFGEEHVSKVAQDLEKAAVSPAVLVDCSHANSGKKFENQPAVWREIVRQHLSNQRGLLGLMAESNIHEGNQPFEVGQSVRGLKYGVSITDECMGWEATEALVRETEKLVKG